MRRTGHLQGDEAGDGVPFGPRIVVPRSGAAGPGRLEYFCHGAVARRLPVSAINVQQRGNWALLGQAPIRRRGRTVQETVDRIVAHR